MVIIEDEPELLESLARLLSIGEEPVFEVHTARTGAEGLALCWSIKPDCVLLDYHLPDIDGLMLLAELVGANGITPFPVVMLTGCGSPEIDRTAIQLGAQDYLEKGSIHAALLKRTLRRAIERHARLREQFDERRRVETALNTLNRAIKENLEERAVALRESEARIRAILNTAAEGIITFDEQGVIHSFNPAAEPLFGYPADEMVGTHIERLIPGLCAPGSAKHGEWVGRRSDGSTFPVEVTLSHLQLHQQQLSITIVRDITERKKAEEARKFFLVATSHDVRNALTAIIGYANALSSGVSQEEAQRALERINSLAETLSALMSDIVTHSSLQQETNVSRQTTSLRSLLVECAQDIEPRCKEKGLLLKLVFPQDVTIEIDRMKVVRILQNLLMNALRYTPSGEIELRGEVSPAAIRLLVRDTGIGIPANALPHIFEPYFRHHAARELEPLGSGLGLAIVKRLCELLGAEIAVDSTPGTGTTFTVTIPNVPPAGAAAVTSVTG